MNTRERLEQFQEMVRQGKPPEELKSFVGQNNSDKRFVSLVNLRSAFMESFKQELEKSIARSNTELAERIEYEMQEYGLDVMQYAKESAQARAKQLTECYM